MFERTQFFETNLSHLIDTKHTMFAIDSFKHSLQDFARLKTSGIPRHCHLPRTAWKVYEPLFSGLGCVKTAIVSALFYRAETISKAQANASATQLLRDRWNPLRCAQRECKAKQLRKLLKRNFCSLAKQTISPGHGCDKPLNPHSGIRKYAICAVLKLWKTRKAFLGSSAPFSKWSRYRRSTLVSRTIPGFTGMVFINIYVYVSLEVQVQLSLLLVYLMETWSIHWDSWKRALRPYRHLLEELNISSLKPHILSNTLS